MAEGATANGLADPSAGWPHDAAFGLWTQQRIPGVLTPGSAWRRNSGDDIPGGAFRGRGLS